MQRPTLWFFIEKEAGAIFSSIRSNLRVLACLFFVGGVYVYALGPTVGPQGDSGELISVAYLLGIAHPPGYPLYTLLGHFFSLIPVNSVAWRLNLFAAVCHLGALFFVYLTVLRITNKWLVATGAMLVLAFSYTFWLYSLVAEVFSLNDLIAAGIIYVSVVLIDKRSYFAKRKWSFLLIFLFGLGLSNHHSVILLGPAIFYLLTPLLKEMLSKWTLKQKFSFVAISLVVFILGLSSYLYIFLRAKTAVVAVAWSYPVDWSSLTRMFLRSDYGSLVPFQGAQPAMATLAQKAGQVTTYFRFLWDDLSSLGIILLAMGTVFGFWRRRRLTMFFLLGFLTNLFFLTYANFPINEFTGTTLAITERFYLIGNIFAVFLVALGLEAVFIFLANFKILRLLPIPLTVFFLTLLFWGNYGQVSQRGNYLGRDLAKNILTAAPKNSLVIPGGDVATFLTMYERYVEGFRPDTDLWTGNLAGPDNSYRFLKKTRPDLDFSMPEAATMGGVVRLNFGRAPVLLSDQPSFRLAGLTSSPSGFLYYFQRDLGVQSFGEWKKVTDENLEKYLLPTEYEILTRNTMGDRVIMGAYANMYTNLGYFCRANVKWDCAVGFFQKALSFDSYVTATRILLADSYSQMKNCDQAQKEYEEILKENSPLSNLVYTDLVTLAKDCWKDTDKIKYYENLRDQTEENTTNDFKAL